MVKSWYCYALITPKKASKICLDRTTICMESLVRNVTCLGMGIHCKYILILKTRVHLRTFNDGHVPSKQIRFHHCPCHVQTLQVWSQGPVPSLQSLLHYKKTERCSNLATKFVQSHVYVVIQIYPWFKFYFPLAWGMVMRGNEFGTKGSTV